MAIDCQFAKCSLAVLTFAATMLFGGVAKADEVVSTDYGVTITLKGSGWEGGCRPDPPFTERNYNPAVGCIWGKEGARIIVYAPTYSGGFLDHAVYVKKYTGEQRNVAKREDPTSQMELSGPVEADVGGVKIFQYTNTFLWDSGENRSSAELFFVPIQTPKGTGLVMFEILTEHLHNNPSMARYARPEAIAEFVQLND